MKVNEQKLLETSQKLDLREAEIVRRDEESVRSSQEIKAQREELEKAKAAYESARTLAQQNWENEKQTEVGKINTEKQQIQDLHMKLNDEIQAHEREKELVLKLRSDLEEKKRQLEDQQNAFKAYQTEVNLSMGKRE